MPVLYGHLQVLQKNYIKLKPIIVQFCHPIYKMKVKPLEVQSVRDDTSDIVMNALKNSILKFNIEKRILWGSIDLMEHSAIVKKQCWVSIKKSMEYKHS